MLVAVRVANLTLGPARSFQEFGTLAVSIEREGLYHQPMALLAVFSDNGLLDGGLGGLCLGRRAGGLCKGKEKDYKNSNNEQSANPYCD
jgi:hypothetical protein